MGSVTGSVDVAEGAAEEHSAGAIEVGVSGSVMCLLQLHGIGDGSVLGVAEGAVE